MSESRHTSIEHPYSILDSDYPPGHLHELKRSPRVENLPSVWKGFSLFFLRRLSPLGAPADEPTDQSVGGRPTVTDAPTWIPRFCL